MNGKILSSTGSGYLILPQLADSTYNLTIDFPQNKWAEQSFQVIINKKDHGFLLKNFGEKGWGLFDLQSLSVQMAAGNNENGSNEVKTGKREVSAFTEILSKAAGDPSLKEKTVQTKKIEEKKPAVVSDAIIKKEETKPVVIPDATVKEEIKPIVKEPEKKEEMRPVAIEQPMVKKEEPKVEIKEPPAGKQEEIKATAIETFKKSIVTKKSESSTTGGFGLVYVDDYGDGVIDTIRIIIPNIKPVVTEVKQLPKEEKKFLEISSDTTVAAKKEEEVVSNKEVTSIKAPVQNNCTDIASDNDFLKLRKKMASEITDEGMLSEAAKYFKTKCFTVAQIKNLGSLFLNDAGKYKFFDGAYSYVSNVEDFTLLQAELKDEYYINRFKAMLRH
jgi:hypothetical protein